MWDVIIAGAGPAGLVSATVLARSGRRVLLLDPQASGRHKIGESVPGAMARLLAKLGLPGFESPGSPHRRIGGIISLWAGELRTEDHLTTPEGGGWRLDRGAFEKELSESAALAGTIRMPARVARINRRNQSWQIETEGGDRLDAGFLIDATGRNAAIARRQGARQIHGPPLVAVWSMGRATRDVVSNRTFIESTADGWWYAAYLPDRRPLAIFHASPALATELRDHPKQWLERLRKTEHIATHMDPDAFYRTALKSNDARSSHLDQPCGPGWAACGDAALSFDPLSSQGIFNAMASADMISTAILQGTSMEDYSGSLDEIRAIYHKRRNLLYDSAGRYFASSFWTAFETSSPIVRET
ncbi:tryptophan 7-halogenase [Luteolibacter ambystomatis]|uniref:Tryptophan 7-halogenase n=1 Tax=Luteolibacter ambystomatis TaxID=2824561 RepID=A0A975J1V4_9BACT|nr:FAD-dependent oxidoreductase [Luteolibacter ambystomatis]QUE52492.1 tryptophan 7-halogenase [Luteolibacter ambystomatis]